MKKQNNDFFHNGLILLSIAVLFYCAGSCSGAASGTTASHDVAMSQESISEDASRLVASKQN